jgi:hypothetical protein
LILNIKRFFAVWYLVLWGICTYAIFEYYYPHQTYGVPQILYVAAAFSSFLLLAVTGGPLYFYLKRRQLRKIDPFLFTALFLVATVFLASSLAQLASVSAMNKSKAQWYIDDLKKQGFNVEYSSHYPYGHWHVEYVSSYSNFTTIAREINCEKVRVCAGVPSYFLFYVPSEIELVAAGKGYYIFEDH